jgi:hypothetical protein
MKHNMTSDAIAVAFSPPDAAHATADSDDATADPVTQNASRTRGSGLLGNRPAEDASRLVQPRTPQEEEQQELGRDCRALVPLTNERSSVKQMAYGLARHRPDDCT